MIGIAIAGFAAGLAMRAGYDMKDHVKIPEAVITAKEKIVGRGKDLTKTFIHNLDEKLNSTEDTED